MNLKQKLFLVRFNRSNDDLGESGFIEGAKFCLEHRKKWSLSQFKIHYETMKKQLINNDSYEKSLLYALKCNIQELEEKDEFKFTSKDS